MDKWMTGGQMVEYNLRAEGSLSDILRKKKKK